MMIELKDVFLSIGCVFLLFSFFCNSVILLRSYAQFSFLTFALTAFIANNLVALFWQLLLLSINGFILYRLIDYAYLPRKLPKEAERIYQQRFSLLTRREYQDLTHLADRTSFDENQLIFKQGEKRDKLLLVLSGSVAVKRGALHVAYVDSGHFIGEVSFFTNDIITADIVAESRVECLHWSNEVIANYLSYLKQTNPELHAKHLVCFYKNSVEKLLATVDAVTVKEQ